MKRILTGGLLIVSMCLVAGQALAERMEFTPGPRMIEALEQISRDYLAQGQAVGLTERQRQAVRDILLEFKKEMWMKEAVLVGMFMELESKRRYGLLEGGAYQTANVVTAGLETDELNLLIVTLKKLQEVFSAEQQAMLRTLVRQPLVLEVPQGFTTRIALLSLGGIGELYGRHREALHLTDEQAGALRAKLTDARAELLRLGTAIDINRTEAYELLAQPFVDPEAVRAKMQKTGEMEGVLFSKLLDLSKEVEALLTPGQRAAHRERKRSPHGGVTTRPGSRSPHHGMAHRGREADLEHFRFFLDQIDALALKPEQIAELVALENETTKALLVQEAKRKAWEIELVALLQRPETGEGSPDDAISRTIRRLEGIETERTEERVGAYLRARRLLTPAQRAHIPPMVALDAND